MSNNRYIDMDNLIDELIPIFNKLSPQDKGDIMETIYKQKIVELNENFELESNKNFNTPSNFILNATSRLIECFPKGKLLYDREPCKFLAHPKGNIYFILGNCENRMDVDCKVLEWFSRAAYKTEPYYANWKNEEFHEYFRNGISKYFSWDFSKEEIEQIYIYLGNACNHEKTIKFIESGFDMEILNQEMEK